MHQCHPYLLSRIYPSTLCSSLPKRPHGLKFRQHLSPVLGEKKRRKTAHYPLTLCRLNHAGLPHLICTFSSSLTKLPQNIYICILYKTCSASQIRTTWFYNLWISAVANTHSLCKHFISWLWGFFLASYLWLISSTFPYCSIHSWPTMMLWTQHVGFVHV